MKMYFFRAVLLSGCLMLLPTVQAEDITTADNDTSTSTTNTTESSSKLKVQEIREQDRFGSIEEDRVQAMRSELRYVPTGSATGYNLITSENSQGKSQNAHQQGGLNIPSWKLFSW